MNNIITQQHGMTSLQISETTGKRHDAVLRDIRALLKQGVSAHNFVEASYNDKQGKSRPMCNLTPKGCLILASGYDAVLREKIIDKLEELTIQARQLPPPSEPQDTVGKSDIDVSLRWIKGMSVVLTYRNATYELAVSEGKRLDMPVPETLAPESEQWLSASVLLRRYRYRGVDVYRFNEKMLEMGHMAEICFRNSHGRTVRVKRLMTTGFRYARHQQKADGTVYIAYRASSFPSLMAELGFRIFGETAKDNVKPTDN